MAEARAALKAVDRVEITTLVDNSIDVFLPSTKEIRRAQVPSNLPWGERKSLVFRARLLGASQRADG